MVNTWEVSLALHQACWWEWGWAGGTRARLSSHKSRRGNCPPEVVLLQESIL